MCGNKGGNRHGQFREMADDPIGLEFGHRTLAVAEIDGNNRDAGRACGENISYGISDHYSALHCSARSRDRASENFRSRFLDAEGVGAANSCKPNAEPELIEQEY